MSDNYYVGDKKVTVRVGNSGLTLGSAIAVAVSWSANKSILWAILHGIFGWFYVIYYAFGGGR